ncbi:MAG: hypothetical protein D6766_07400 [Verrucomicrobia bacterium]|nr:MAG: hypothetical protein D6766_07400 [Verrucomicrobiota bacterium]
MVFGPFTIVEGYSRNGGLLCPVDNPPTPPPSGDCAPCDGKVTQLTLQYDGADQPLVEVYDKKGNLLGSVQLDATGLFTIDGADLNADRNGTLGTEIALVIDGVEVARIHTSCSQPIGPGMVFGPFTIVEGYSRNGGLLCPTDGTQSTSEPKDCQKERERDKKEKEKRQREKQGKKGEREEYGKAKKSRGGEACDDDDDDHGKGQKKGRSKLGKKGEREEYGKGKNSRGGEACDDDDDDHGKGQKKGHSKHGDDD